LGTDSTHWRYGTRGSTWSIMWAAVSTMRRVAHEGQMSRLLQLNAIMKSWPQAAQGDTVDIGGYFHPDDAKTAAAMRPSGTFNGIVDGL
jgi:monomeric isocitrate dehydrogenase